MTTVRPCEVPLSSLLRKYAQGAGCADCHVVEVAGAVSQASFVEAFYTSALFKIERTLLKLLAARPSTDAQARQLAAGQVTTFAAWRVEGQSGTELLLADFTGRTRSWLMTSPGDAGAKGAGTLLHFGSAVVPRRKAGSGQPALGWAFHVLLGFHRLYSRLLLGAARRRLLAHRPG